MIHLLFTYLEISRTHSFISLLIWEPPSLFLFPGSHQIHSLTLTITDHHAPHTPYRLSSRLQWRRNHVQLHKAHQLSNNRWHSRRDIRGVSPLIYLYYRPFPTMAELTIYQSPYSRHYRPGSPIPQAHTSRWPRRPRRSPAQLWLLCSLRNTEIWHGGRTTTIERRCLCFWVAAQLCRFNLWFQAGSRPLSPCSVPESWGAEAGGCSGRFVVSAGFDLLLAVSLDGLIWPTWSWVLTCVRFLRVRTVSSIFGASSYGRTCLFPRFFCPMYVILWLSSDLKP